MSEQNYVKNVSLYHFQACPFCNITRKVINDLGLALPFNDINKNPEFRKELIEGGGKPQVPCLKIEISNGQTHWLYESGDIIHFIRQYEREMVKAA